MTVRHLPGLDHDRWYLIDVDHGADALLAPWRHRGLWLHGPRLVGHVEWSALPRHGFGVGFELCRNDSERDVAVALYAGRLGSLWASLAAPWLSWTRVRPGTDEEYLERRTGLRLFGARDRWIEFKVEDREGTWRSGQPWWRSWSFGTRQVLGRVHVDTAVEATGTTTVPMPEGAYAAMWREEVMTYRYVRPLGSWRDWFLGRRVRRSVWLEIEGGIPKQGKGENSWDCGMDGLFGCGGKTVEDAVAHAVGSVLRDRARYGGPHDLGAPLTVAQAEAR